MNVAPEWHYLVLAESTAVMTLPRARLGRPH